MTDLPMRAASLFANFRTIRFPMTEECVPRSPTHWEWWRAAKAEYTAAQTVHDYRQRLRLDLITHGLRLSLDHVEPDPDGGWRLHIFVADAAAVLLLNGITDERCGAGDPASFNPEEFIRTQL